MPRETARDHLCSRYAAVIAACARTTSRLTPRPSYKSFSTFNWPICRYRRSTCASLMAPSAGAALEDAHRTIDRVHSEMRRQLGDGPVAPDCRHRHLRLERRAVLLPCPLHVLLPRYPRFLGAGLHLSHLSHFRGPAHSLPCKLPRRIAEGIVKYFAIAIRVSLIDYPTKKL